MPELPFTPPAVPGGGDLPVRSTEDVKTLLPKGIQQAENAPVRDALVEALTKIAFSWQEAASAAAAQADIGRATDQFLVGAAEDRSSAKQLSESDAAFRARALAVPATVSRKAIVDAVNAILAPFTAIQCRVFDSILDRMYVFNGSGPNTSHCYVSAPSASGNIFSGPNYPDRLYPEYAAQNGGAFLPNSSPGGAWAFGDCVGRYFVVRVPDLAPVFASHAFTTGQTLPSPGTHHLYVFTGAATNNDFRAYVSGNSLTAIAVYQAIVNSVNNLIGQSMRWQLFVDPNLKA